MSEEKKPSLADVIKEAPVLGKGQSMSKMTDDAPLDMGNVRLLVEEHCPDGWEAGVALRGLGEQATAQIILTGPLNNRSAFPLTTVGELRKVLKYFCQKALIVYECDAHHNDKRVLGLAYGHREACEIIEAELKERSRADDGDYRNDLGPEQVMQLKKMGQTQTSGEQYAGEFMIEWFPIHRRMRE